MKRFEVYKNIRKHAMIMGLSISHFAMMMSGVIGSLLYVIFSFSFYGIIAVFILNAALYIVLTHLSRKSLSLDFKSVFPVGISNKNQSPLYYEED